MILGHRFILWIRINTAASWGHYCSFRLMVYHFSYFDFNNCTVLGFQMIILLKKFVSNIMEHAAQCLEGDKEQVLFGIFIKKKQCFGTVCDVR